MQVGDVPNLLWQGITFEELSQHPRYQSLASQEEIHLTEPAAYRQAFNAFQALSTDVTAKISTAFLDIYDAEF